MDRKTLPAALLYANEQEHIVGRTRLQKLVFLIEMAFQEEDGSLPLSPDSYNFEPYDYGPFSKELYDDIDSLKKQDLIREISEEYKEGEVRYVYEIEDQGKQLVENNLDKEEMRAVLRLSSNFKGTFNDDSLPDLIKEVYSRYPKFAENSIY
ncbi:hypothetical protein C482_02451 [Natrialba chahannaoensis JCM 10990]|uniref:Antitoxin SocA-like Panacea domain-containing protein n=1 Tax=Natrialba chahannaoensis JCM 10990 TaxID=1227492 RepID=M0B6U4_9EURY|nr:type II toxin-antitoxin system antitoxin SocA domain-containing protein [Natrialba chahannaoensis]ELZ05374.1 hypothetical protein C482_02451 [Natrialba chahannaoensis JCM 10990]